MYHINSSEFLSALRGESSNFTSIYNNIINIDVANFELYEEVLAENEDYSNSIIILFGKNTNSKITFTNSKFNRIVFNGSINITFNNCSFDEVDFSQIGKDFIVFSSCNITKLSGDWYCGIFTNIKVDNLIFDIRANLSGFKKINFLTFAGFGLHFSNFIIPDYVENIVFDNFSDNKGTFENFISHNNSEIIIVNSNLTGITFFNCDLSKSIIKFRKSNLTELNYINSKLPTKAIELEDNKTSVEVYRQLKIVSKNHYDRFNELRYKALEQDAYYCSLHPLKDFNAWFVLWFSRVSNFYGTQWWYSIPLILISGLFFYIIYHISLNNNFFIYHDFWKNYWLFVTPLHKFELMGSGFNYSGWSYFIDIFYRILNYFFIYQGVQAFRMYGKT